GFAVSPRPLEKHPHLLPWYAARTLQAEAAEEVKRHVAGCPECRHVVEQMSAMAGSLSADASPVHVHPSDLIRYETDGFEGALEVGQEVEAHLIRCAACRQDLARLRLHRREEDAREGKPPVMNS